MKKCTICILCIFTALFLAVFAHSAMLKSDLRQLLNQKNYSEAYYTTASYDTYTAAVSSAKAIIRNPLVRPKKVIEAKNNLQTAVDGLKISTQEVYRITYHFTLRSNRSVGNDWQQTVTCNGHPLHSGDTLTAPANTSVTLHCTVFERDSIPDIGYGTVELRLRDGINSSVQISVKENRGRFKGNTAIWEFSYSVVRIARV